VAVAAINTVVANVMLVTELYRLRARNVGLCVVAGTIEFHKQPKQSPADKDGTEDAHLGDGVSALMKYLGHDAGSLRIKDFRAREIFHLPSADHCCRMQPEGARLPLNSSVARGSL
jgi:hypothetical protein